MDTNYCLTPFRKSNWEAFFHKHKVPRHSWRLHSLGNWSFFETDRHQLHLSSRSIFAFHCHYYTYSLCCSIHPSLCPSSFLPSLPPIPHYPPPQRNAVRVLGVRWAVKSHKLLLLCVCPGNRGGKQTEREGETDFMLQHFWTWIKPPPLLPLLPLNHSDVDKHTHSCKNAYVPTTAPTSSPNTCTTSLPPPLNM